MRRSQNMLTETKISGQLGAYTASWPSSTTRSRCSTRPRRAHAEGYRDMDAYVADAGGGLGGGDRFPQQLGAAPGVCGRLLRSDRRVHVVLVDHGDRISAQCGRTAAELLAGLRSHHFRMHGAGCVPHGSNRNAGAERAAAALSSGLQRGSNSRAHRGTSFSCASRRRIRSLM